MNRKQMVVLWVGLSIFLLIGIFPPWLYTSVWGEGIHPEKDAGYYFILIPPKPEKSLMGIKLDVQRLCVQWIIVSVATGGFILTFRGKKKTE